MTRKIVLLFVLAFIMEVCPSFAAGRCDGTTPEGDTVRRSELR